MHGCYETWPYSSEVSTGPFLNCRTVLATDARTRSSAARMGGLVLHIRHDSHEIAKRARRGLQARFEREALAIDPSLTGERLEAKVRLIQKLHMVRMGRASGKARRRET